LNRRSRDGWDIRNVVPYGIGFWRFSDGSIESPGLPRGTYDLFIDGATFDSGSSHIAFDIINHDVDLGTLTAQRLTPLTGRVLGIAKAYFDTMRVTLTPLDGHDRLLASSASITARIASDGTFQFTNPRLSQPGGEPVGSVGDGIYQVGLSGLPADRYLEYARYAGRDTLDNGLHIEGNPSSLLEITIGIGGTIHGVVLKKGWDTVQDSQVILIPSADHRGNFNLYKTASSDQNGAYRIRGIAPGNYEIRAWEEVDPNAWLNEEFMNRPYQGGSYPLTITSRSSLEVYARVPYPIESWKKPK
jgi:hypothetical protein